MSNTTIESTVHSTLNERGLSGYSGYAAPVVDALKAREEAIKEGLAEYANGRGLSNSEVESLFVEVGLSQPAPEPEVEVAPVADDSAKEQVLSALSALAEAVRNL